MASIIATSLLNDISTGAVVVSTATFKAMLLTSSHTPSKNHAKRSDLTNEATGTGYVAGGATVTCTVAIDTSLNKETYTFSFPSWTTATISAQYLAIYVSRGGVSSADNLVTVVDNGTTGSSTAATFTFTISTPLTIQN